MATFDIQTMSEVTIPTRNDHEISFLTRQQEPADVNDSESSSDDEEEDPVKILYAQLPEDLGFTLVGLDFDENEFKKIRRLKLDLDTFMTLQEDELLELGVKDAAKLKQFIKSKLLKNGQYHNIFTKDKKDPGMSQEEYAQLYGTFSTIIQALEKCLIDTQIIMHQSPPLNYEMVPDHNCLSVFKKAVKVYYEQVVIGYNVAQRQSRELDEFLATGAITPVVKTKSNAKKKRKQVWIKRAIVITTFSILIFAIGKKVVRP